MASSMTVRVPVTLVSASSPDRATTSDNPPQRERASAPRPLRSAPKPGRGGRLARNRSPVRKGGTSDWSAGSSREPAKPRSTSSRATAAPTNPLAPVIRRVRFVPSLSRTWNTARGSRQDCFRRDTMTHPMPSAVFPTSSRICHGRPRCGAVHQAVTSAVHQAERAPSRRRARTKAQRASQRRGRLPAGRAPRRVFGHLPEARPAHRRNRRGASRPAHIWGPADLPDRRPRGRPQTARRCAERRPATRCDSMSTTAAPVRLKADGLRCRVSERLLHPENRNVVRVRKDPEEITGPAAVGRQLVVATDDSGGDDRAPTGSRGSSPPAIPKLMIPAQPSPTALSSEFLACPPTVADLRSGSRGQPRLEGKACYHHDTARVHLQTGPAACSQSSRPEVTP